MSEYAFNIDRVHPVSKDNLMREVFVVGTLDQKCVVEVFRVLVPKKGHKQFKNQLAARTAFTTYEKSRAAQGARYTYEIQTGAPTAFVAEHTEHVHGFAELYKLIGYNSNRARRYAVDSTCAQLEANEAYRETVTKDYENILRAINSGDSTRSSAKVDPEGARP
jgi:hypothetical protein|uniref:Uncharacterized protein n=1 Tax=Myoviridae sp. ctshb19 TaxID=2825194 RepID=A0A8S5UGA6_9CAUD|nr:MAG TPA: hypothetical protein [Myoviridae sp. ctshb19]